jgi:N-acyl-D-aspartate/D-glutamate deacylase
MGLTLRFLLFALVAISTILSAQQSEYDLVLAGGRIVDGTGNPWFLGDLAISGDSIAALGPAGSIPGGRVRIDVKGLVVSPGFLDTHSHARRGIFETTSAENCIRQGVTTLMEGPDGSAPIPLRDLLTKVKRTRIAVNFGSLAGHGSIREAVIGTENRIATQEELQTMRPLRK